MSDRQGIAAVSCGVLLLVAACPRLVSGSELPVTDPTQAPFSPVAPISAATADRAGALKLYSTRVSPSGWTALINDRVVGIGDRIEGAQVLEIVPGRVSLRRAQETFTLQLNWPSVKRPAASGEE